MRFRGIYCCVAVVLSAAFASAEDEKVLNGAWVAVAAMQNGEKVSDDLVKGAKFVFDNGKFTASLGDITDSGTVSIDRSKKPNTIDWNGKDAGKKKKSNNNRFGVFELDGDTLTLGWNLVTGKRPTDLTSTAENKNFVVVYKREK
jgi:uncharacterized protein (TIGR03067 family)